MIYEAQTLGNSINIGLRLAIWVCVQQEMRLIDVDWRCTV